MLISLKDKELLRESTDSDEVDLCIIGDVDSIDLYQVTLLVEPIKANSNVGSSMIRRILNELSIVMGKLSGQYALRDRLKEFGYEIEDVQLEKLELECLTRLINANELVCSDDLYRFRLLLMENRVTEEIWDKDELYACQRFDEKYVKFDSNLDCFSTEEGKSLVFCTALQDDPYDFRPLLSGDGEMKLIVRTVEKVTCWMENFDVVVWHDGGLWRITLDSLYDSFDCGKLADFVAPTNYMIELKYGLCSRIDAYAIVVNVYDEGIILRIVTDRTTHVTHVAGFATVSTQISHLNGVAHGAILISEKIGDSRFCLMETGTKLTYALIDAMEQLCLEVLETVHVKHGVSQLRFPKGLIPPVTTFVLSLMFDMLDAMENAIEHFSWFEFVLKIPEFSLSVLPQQTGDDELRHTTNYVSPEVINDRDYYGVILFVLMVSYLPFEHHNLMSYMFLDDTYCFTKLHEIVENVKDFVRLFEEVTRNEFDPWEREKKFKKKPLKFHPIDMEDGVDVRCGRLELWQISVATSHCKLEPRVANVMKVH
ncbi:hypothetical protein V6N12_037627 [Hibiscus sabdariffa]|uniref:Uncharacterized protein n=1 Tax=Hibiscus sabdariffa TaxID=183260 RepID=A0ABR2C176_9ROSI